MLHTFLVVGYGEVVVKKQRFTLLQSRRIFNFEESPAYNMQFWLERRYCAGRCLTETCLSGYFSQNAEVEVADGLNGHLEESQGWQSSCLQPCLLVPIE